MTPTRLTAAAVAVSLGAVSFHAPLVAQQGMPMPAPNKALLPVQGGQITIGRTAKELHASLEILHPFNLQGRIADATRMMSELGQKQVQVTPFQMAKNLVTMEQYKIFVDKTGHRFPFDWWRFGCEEDYNKRLADIKREYPEADNAPLEFWKDNWKDLPSKIPIQKGKRNKPDVPMDQFPVVYVSWRDAVAFAAWAGMRLPTEAEWLFAATGGQPREFLWGDDIKGLKVKRGPRYDKPLPVGAHGEATSGQFGHQDMCLHVFEWTGDTGFFPFDSRAFDRERDKFLKHKLWRSLEKKVPERIASLQSYRPNWRGPARIAKGGWYGSTKEQLRLGLRAAQADFQVRAGLGFRVAKSPYPARDIAQSMIELDYDISYAGQDRAPNLLDQIGEEIYDFAPGTNLIQGYDAISFVPINHTPDDKRLKGKDKYKAGTLLKPQIIGTLVTTKPLTEPAVESGIYTVCYRISGASPELKKAWADARKAVTKEVAAAAKKAKEAEKAKKKKKKKDKKAAAEKDRKWEKTLRRYGLTADDVKKSLGGPTKSVQFVRLKPGDLELPIDVPRFILRDKEGKNVSSWPTKIGMEVRTKYENGHSTLKIEPAKDKKLAEKGLEEARFEFGVPVGSRAKGKVYKFTLKTVLDWK